MTDEAADLRRWTRARTATAAVFAVHGAVGGNFASRIPTLKDGLHLSSGQLGLALVFPAVGAAAAMPLVARINHRYGSRATMRGLLTLWCASLVLPALAPGLPWLCLALFGYGAAAGMADVSMNSHGTRLEEVTGRSTMSMLHGLWSVGVLAGAGAGVLALRADLAVLPHFAAAAVVLMVIGWLSCAWLPDTRSAPQDEPPAAFAFPPRSAWLIGAVGFCAVFAEGAGSDWSGVYLRTVTGAPATVGAASYAVFAGTMAVTRLVGDRLVQRVGAVRTVRMAGALATVGCALIVIARTPPLAIAGFGLVGVGIAVVVPLAFAAAGHTGTHASQAIAGVATVTYASGLVAPAVIGAVADISSLPVSFALVTALVAVIAVAAGVLRR